MTRSMAFRTTTCAALCVLGASSASAALFDRGPDMVYDDVLDITWTRNANLAQTSLSSGFTWAQASTWASNLVFAGYDDWRLPYASVIAGAGQSGPTTTANCQTAGEAQCRDNEMGYMFYHNLGGSFFNPKTGDQTALGGEVLTNIQLQYWSGTEFFALSNPEDRRWLFDFGVGGQGGFELFHDQLSAWAVRSGDVAPIPEPETYAMLLAGLGLLGFAARRRNRKESTSV